MMSAHDGVAEPDLAFLKTPEGLAGARAAVRLLSDFYKGFEIDPAYVTGEGAVNRFSVVWGWFSRCVRTSELVINACDSGHGGEAAPLVRSLLEHTVALQWLVDSGEPAFAALSRQSARHRAKLWDNIVISGWPVPAGMEVPTGSALPLEGTEEDALVGNFSALLDRYGQSRLPFQFESQELHATIDSGIRYCEYRLDGVLVPNKQFEKDDQSSVLAAAHYAIWAFQALHRAIGDPRLLAPIEAASDALGVQFELPVAIDPSESTPTTSGGVNAQLEARKALAILTDLCAEDGALTLIAGAPDKVRARIGAEAFERMIPKLQSVSAKAGQVAAAVSTVQSGSDCA